MFAIRCGLLKVEQLHALARDLFYGRRGRITESEADLHVIDGALLNGGRAFARRYREALWGEHLNLHGPQQRLLEDPSEALSFWLNPPAGVRIRPYDEDTELGLLVLGEWGRISDPDDAL